MTIPGAIETADSEAAARPEAAAGGRDPFAWYGRVEAVWAIAAVVAVCVFPVADLPGPWLALLLGPGGFFAVVRVVAGIADLQGGGR